mgnify:FL=1
MVVVGSMIWLNLFLLNVILGMWISVIVLVYPLVVCVDDETELD